MENGLTQALEAVDLMFRSVPAADVLGRDDLIREYAEECSIPEIGKIDPQRQVYDAMEKSGLMHTRGAFVDGSLVGFATILIFVLPHYGKKIANVESLFLSKSHRRGAVGRGLMAHVEQFAKAQGCVAMLYNARSGTNLEKLLGALPQYQKTNSVFLRSLS